MSKDGQLNDYLRALANNPYYYYTPPEGYKVHSEQVVERSGRKMIGVTLWRIGWNKKGGHRDEIRTLRKPTVNDRIFAHQFTSNPMLNYLARKEKEHHDRMDTDI